MIQEDYSQAGIVSGIGRSVPIARPAVAVVFFLAAWPATGAAAEVEPYCPPVSRQAREIYDIDKWCASVNGDLNNGRVPNLGERLEQSRRKLVEASPVPQPRKASESADAVSEARQPGTEPGTRSTRNVESDEPGDSTKTDRAPDLTADQESGGPDDPQPQKGVVPAVTGVPTPGPSTPSPSSAPSASHSASASSPAGSPGVGTERHGAGPRPDVTGPLGAALVFGLLVMVLAAALIARVRSRLGLAGVGPSAEGDPVGGGDLLQGDHSHGQVLPVAMAAGTQAPAAEPAEVRMAGVPESLRTDAPAPAGQRDEPPGAPMPAREAAMVTASLGLVGSGFVAAPGKAKVEVLGVPRVTWSGKEVSFGRAEARDLFALLSVSRDGVLADGIVEALWPGDGERGGRWLESAVREINQAMRQATGCASGVRFVVKSGERRLLPVSWFDVDYWRFGDACQRASTATDDATRTAALQEALALYRGPLLAGRDDLWVAPVRQAAQRHAVNAAERLAELVRTEEPGRAVDVLQLAVERIDPCNEALWCQLMTVQGELGRLPTVRRSFELLKERLAEIDAVPSAQARQVYEQFLS